MLFCCDILLLTTLSAQIKVDTLTNKSVVQLKNAGLGSEIIKAKIRTSFCKFDLSTNDLITLKKAGLTDEILSAMMDKGDFETAKLTQPSQSNTGIATTQTYPSQRPIQAAPVAYASNAVSITTGIFYCKGKPYMLVELDPSIYSQGKAGSGIGTALTYGISKTKVKSSISGGTANLQIPDKQPEFHFYFGQNGAGQNGSSGMSQLFATASSPNEFLLVKFKASKTNREVVTGAVGIGGLSSGIDEKNKVSFRYEKISQGIYRVFTDQPLKAGEYAFMYAGSMSAESGSALQKAYDFSIH